MASFAEMFESDISFSHSDYRSLPKNRAIWTDAIYNQFGDSIKLPPDTPLELKFFNSTDDEAVVLGGMIVTFGGRKVIFPFVVKDNKISPFDMFLVPSEGQEENGSKYLAYPALPLYLEKLQMGQPLGTVQAKEPGSTTSRSSNIRVGGTFVGQSMPEVMRLMEESKLAAFFAADPLAAEPYVLNPKLGSALNSVIVRCRQAREVLRKTAADASAYDAERVVSAVAHPLSLNTFSVGILYGDGSYKEAKLSPVEAEKLYPVEVSAVVKRAAKLAASSDASDVAGLTQSSDTAVGPLRRPQTASGQEANQYVLAGPLSKDGNLIDWDGSRLNYDVTLSKTLDRVTEGELNTPVQIIFTDPDTGRSTPPLMAKRKIVIGGKTTFSGLDVFHRRIHALIDPDIYAIFQETGPPERSVRVPRSWEIRVLPVTIDSFRRTLIDKMASLPVDKQIDVNDRLSSLHALDKLAGLAGRYDRAAGAHVLRGDYNPRFDTYTLAGTPRGVHDGSGYSWTKVACILNHYVGERFREFRGGSGVAMEYTPPARSSAATVAKTASAPVALAGDPVMIREVPRIVAMMDTLLPKTASTPAPHDLVKRVYASWVGLRLPDTYRTKYAAMVPTEDAPDVLLGFNSVTPDAVEEAYKNLPKLEEVIQFLTDLLLTARMSGSVPEEDVKRAIDYCAKVMTHVRDAAAEKTTLVEDQLSI